MAMTCTYTLSLPDALPISETFHFVGGCANSASVPAEQDPQWSQVRFAAAQQFPPIPPGSRIESISILYDRSEEHTSELQSPCNLVCRLLLEKKKPIHLTCR